jgi:DNA end-binding protein Ku
MKKKVETATPSTRPMWSGRISIGLVNVPVKLYTMIHEQAFSFRLLHKDDGQPLKYERVCVRDEKVVKWGDVVRGYEVRKNEFVVFEKDEIESARPDSDERIRVDRFIDYLSMDPIYFEKSYILTPDKSEDAYSLLLEALRRLGKAGVGRVTMRTKEYPCLIYAYKGALILTTLHYSYEVVDPGDMEEIVKFKEPGKAELDMAIKIISNLSGEFDISLYRDGFREKIEALIKKKVSGETIVAEEPKKEEVKELMAALQETVRQLKKK